MTRKLLRSRAAIWMLLLTVASVRLFAQSTTTYSGDVLDPKGNAVTGAAVTVRNDATQSVQRVATDSTGIFNFSALPEGAYTLEITAPGFETARRSDIHLVAGTPGYISISLTLSKVTEQITVNADEVNSIAAQLAPMTQSLAATSARSEITSTFIRNYLPPTADFGEIVQMVPGTFTTNPNGVGLGQSSTYFRGFPDGDYDIDFDGIPFYDTNTPSHHSWAFFPSQWIGSVDFDRSPGTASTIGPTPFGGSIHLLSHDVSPLRSLRGGFNYGSWNTMLFDVAYDTGAILPNHKLSFGADYHHMSSDGYQTYNAVKRDAGSIKAQYILSEKTVLTGYSGVIQLTANAPNFSPTRCQLYGATSDYTCTGTLAPFAGSGVNFLLTDNSDPANYLNYEYNHYHVPTDFEYVGLKSELGHGFTLDVKPYTYNYDNNELFTNATPITDDTTIDGSNTYMGMPIVPCDTLVTKKGVTASPCGVDKYNSYRKYGETSTLSQVSRFGILRAGLWYEWAKTNRHQTPSNPLDNWKDDLLPNFNERFWTNSYQPFAEYEYHVTNKLKITPGVKFSRYTINTMQWADNGKTVGCLVPPSLPSSNPLSASNPCDPTYNTNIDPSKYITNSGSYFSTLPSIDVNYRITNNWSAYGQLATGSIVPPSKVFDYAAGADGQVIPIETLPKQQRSTTWQTGTVVKLNLITFDADYYHVRFQNSYSSTPDNSNGGEPVYFLQPSSITQGFEAESNINFSRGLSAYVNGSVGKATYVGTSDWVQNTPRDTEAFGVTYQNKSLDLGFFDKRVGAFYIDNGAYHNQATVDPFNTANMYFNYTVRSGGRFDRTKIRLSLNNLFDSHSITSITPVGAAVASGDTYATPINGGDNVSVLPGRSVMLSVQFGLSPKR